MDIANNFNADDFELEMMDFDEEFEEIEKTLKEVPYPSISVYKYKDRVKYGFYRNDFFTINKLALPFFTAEAYKLRASDNYIVFIPASRDEKNAYVCHKKADKESSRITIPKNALGIDPGIHKLKKCKWGLCINRKADKALEETA